MKIRAERIAQDLENQQPNISEAVRCKNNLAKSFRADLEGLRAIAIISIMAFHFFPSSMPGGYVGVEIFFVLSGYFGTSTLHKHLHTDSFRFLEYYWARFMRLAPTVAVCLILTLFGGYCLKTQDDFRDLGGMTAASATFSANLHLLTKSSGGYWDKSSASNPLLHMWYLGVHEQFYLLWPRALLCLVDGEGNVQTWWLVTLIFGCWILNMSLAYDIVSVGTQDMAYYFPFARFWELIIGASVALLSPSTDYNIKYSRCTREVMAIVGVSSILLTLTLVDKSFPYPGWLAVLPCIGTALLIAAGDSTFIGQVTSSRVLHTIANISFPLYVLHWPAKVYSDALSPLVKPGLKSWYTCGVICVTIIISMGIHRTVEKPFRKSKNPFIKLLLFSTVLILFLYGLFIFNGNVDSLVESRINAAKQADSAFSTLSHRVSIIEGNRRGADNQTLSSDNGNILADCIKKVTLALVSKASRAWAPPPGDAPRYILNKQSKNTTLVLGDSHANALYSRFRFLYNSGYGHKMNSVAYVTNEGCPVLPGTVQDFYVGADNKPKLKLCKASVRAHQWSMIKALPNVDTVVLKSYWESELIKASFKSNGGKIWPRSRQDLNNLSPNTVKILEKWKDAIREVVNMKKKVYVIQHYPASRRSQLVEKGHWNPANMIVAGVLVGDYRPQAIATYNEQEAYILKPLYDSAVEAGAILVDPTDTLCKNGLCPVIDPDGHPAFKDGHHYCPAYMARYGQFLDKLVGVSNGPNATKYCI